MSWILRPFKAIYRWMAALMYSITGVEDDLDDLYPNRHRADGAESATNASIVSGLSGGSMGLH